MPMNYDATSDGYSIDSPSSLSQCKSTFASKSEVENIRALEESITKSLEFRGTQGPPISLTQYRKSFKSAPVGIYATNSAGEPQFCNDAYYRIIGKPKEPDSPIPVFFDAIHPDYVDQVRLAKRQAMITKKPVTLEYRLKRSWQTMDPVSGKGIISEFWILGTIVPWLDDADSEKINYSG